MFLWAVSQNVAQGGNISLLVVAATVHKARELAGGFPLLVLERVGEPAIKVIGRSTVGAAEGVMLGIYKQTDGQTLKLF